MVERLTVVLNTVSRYSWKSIGRWFDSGHSDFVLNPLLCVSRPSLSASAKSCLLLSGRAAVSLSVPQGFAQTLSMPSLQDDRQTWHFVSVVYMFDYCPSRTLFQHRRKMSTRSSVLDETQPTTTKHIQAGSRQGQLRSHRTSSMPTTCRLHFR